MQSRSSALAQRLLRVSRAVHPSHRLPASETLPMRKPTTGEPCAGEPHARFGGSGGRDQLDDDPIADEWLGAPVLADEGEEAVLDFVPLAGARRQVSDHDVEAELVGQLLQLAFPQPHPRAVAAASPSLRWGRLGGDQHAGRFGIAFPTNGEPPLADAVDGKGGRVMVNADAHPPGIGSEVIDPVRHRPPEFLDQEIMDPDLVRIALRTVLAARVAEIAD